MQWEERQLVPLLAKSSIGESSGAAVVKEHVAQRLRLVDSLTSLQRPDASFANLAKDCIALVRWLEIDLASEEREVLRSIATTD